LILNTGVDATTTNVQSEHRGEEEEEGRGREEREMVTYSFVPTRYTGNKAFAVRYNVLSVVDKETSDPNRIQWHIDPTRDSQNTTKKNNDRTARKGACDEENQECERRECMFVRDQDDENQNHIDKDNNHNHNHNQTPNTIIQHQDQCTTSLSFSTEAISMLHV
jgi:hypothetical protein